MVSPSWGVLPVLPLLARCAAVGRGGGSSHGSWPGGQQGGLAREGTGSLRGPREACFAADVWADVLSPRSAFALQKLHTPERYYRIYTCTHTASYAIIARFVYEGAPSSQTKTQNAKTLVGPKNTLLFARLPFGSARALHMCGTTLPLCTRPRSARARPTQALFPKIPGVGPPFPPPIPAPAKSPTPTHHPSHPLPRFQWPSPLVRSPPPLHVSTRELTSLCPSVCGAPGSSHRPFAAIHHTARDPWSRARWHACLPELPLSPTRAHHPPPFRHNETHPP